MKNYVLAFIAAGLFAIASVLSIINGISVRAVIGFIGALSFLLAGIHWRRADRVSNRRP
ncbi:MAG TPA: hypothetical protein VNR87_03625 [Flavisolibacter sp.]|nr:hypothetical protein [Flavisolibacter sp.]